MQQSDFDTIIIGAGLSGLAAGIRLAMFDKKVCILEKHSIPGGLNSYYERGHRLLDVGLHAMTNFATQGERGKPLTKLLKQLRIPYSDLSLAPQEFSRIIFPNNSMKFSNDIDLLREEVYSQFPDQVDGFNKLIFFIEDFNGTSLDHKFQPAKSVVSQYITDKTLIDMVFFPLLIYGSAWENDMDFAQFVIMFKSIFLEGFSRPTGGVRTILSLLVDKFISLGGVLEYKKEITHILFKENRAYGVKLKNGDEIKAINILSSIGNPETMNLLSSVNNDVLAKPGLMSFTETIMTTEKRPREFGENAAIIFYNARDSYNYQKPEALYDKKSSVICFSNNFSVDDFDEGIIRVTNIANYDQWKKLSKKQYKESKENVLKDAINNVSGYFSNQDVLPTFTDVFTPLTVEKFTSRINGAVYGSPDKLRTGETHIQGLYLCGTDQGFLGIVGAMLSGISMANLHVLSNS